MLVLIACVVAFAQADSTGSVPINQLVRRTWTAQDGAPSDIRDLAQTTDGLLWMGSDSGLARFDGARFVQFKPRYGETLPTTGVRSLAPARDGGLWIVWRNGQVSRWRDNRLTTFGESDGLPTAFQIAESGSGVVVAGTATGIARFADDRWNDVSQEWGYPDTEGAAVWFDRRETLWAESEARVLYLPAGSSRFTDPQVPLTAQPGVRADFAEAQDGTIWMSELGRSAHTIPRMGDQTPMTEVMVGATTLLIDRNGRLWVGSAGDGLRRVSDVHRMHARVIARFGHEAEQFTERDGLLSNYVVSLLEDRDGGIWVATGVGLQRFREAAWYQTTWFRYALIVLVGPVGALAAVLVQRRRHVLAQQTLRSRYDATLAERSRIAQDLHDTLLQGFTGITIQLRAIQRVLSREPDGRAAALETVLASADRTLHDARDAIWDMRAVELDGRDLPDALEGAMRSMLEGASVSVDFSVRGARRPLSPLIETTALRIGREAVMNALRHADARTVEVRLHYTPKTLILQVIDDGRGMKPTAIEAASSDGHLGVAGMQTRAQRVGGMLSITSNQAGGTTVEASLPCAEVA
jgi:signal transduction histidine kinase